MSYQVRKGWPCDGAIDEVLRAATGEEIKDGMIVTVEDGECKVADFTSPAADTDPMCAFVIGIEGVRGTITGLMSQHVIEVDADHYEADTYAAGDALTAKGGKFAKAGTSKVLARVLSNNTTTGMIRLMWHEAR